MLRMNSRFRTAVVITLLFASPLSYAGFATYSPNWPDDADSVDERVEVNVAESPTVIYTDDTNQDDFLANQRVSETNRLYAKLGITLLNAEVLKMANTSEPVLSAAALTQNSVKDNYASWSFGLGTKFQYVRLEVDYFYEKKIPYNVAPLFIGHNGVVSSYLQSQSVWLNLMYDFNKFNIPYFTPYIGGLLGVVWNKTRTAISNNAHGAAQNHSRIAAGWGLEIGARLPFWTRWFGYIDYKYLNHGQARWVSYTGTAQFKGQYVVQGVEFGFQYLLG